MEAINHDAAAPPDASPARCGGGNQTPTSSETSDVNTKNLFDVKDVTDQGVPVEESTSTGWTDEKHSMYLNSMEASFVNQLYNVKHNSTQRNYNIETQFSSGQFKVLRNGCWKQVNFKRGRPEVDDAVDSHVILENQWVQYFRSGNVCRERTSSLQKDKRRKVPRAESDARSKQFSLRGTYAPHLNSVAYNAEVSDQNFVEEQVEENVVSLHCGKRIKMEIVQSPSQYQVVAAILL